MDIHHNNNIIRLYFRSQPIDTNVQIQHGKICKIVSNISIVIKCTQLFQIDTIDGNFIQKAWLYSQISGSLPDIL